jgi:membrane-bound lytic murein transglycosylase A
MRFVRPTARAAAWAASIATAVLLASCGGGNYVKPGASTATGTPIVPGQRSASRLTAVSWQQVPGWQDDSLIGATAALRQNCSRLARQANWQKACTAALRLDDLDMSAARSFFET